jgi:hypothetical protein
MFFYPDPKVILRIQILGTSVEYLDPNPTRRVVTDPDHI